VRDEVEIVEGRALQPGRFELVVGAGAVRTFAGLEVGATIPIKGVAFLVVGRFESGGRANESEAWLDVDVMANVFRRGPYLQSVLVRLDGGDAFPSLSAAVDADRRLAVDLFPEAEFYAAQSESATALMKLVAVTAGVIMALGAVFGAVNSMHTAVAARGREIAILRAIGYGAGPIVVSVLAESLALALGGGILGTAVGWLVFDGRAMASVGATYSQVAFEFAVTPSLAFGGLALALMVGLLGGLPPALAAARRPVVDGLRAA
jgi:putative ABC transport system permease protein